MNVPAVRQGYIRKADRVLILVREKRTILTDQNAEQWQLLSLIRFYLLRALSEWASFKQEYVYPALVASKHADDAALLKQAGRDSHDIQTQYDLFVQKWMLRSPLSLSAEYHAEAWAMMNDIERAVSSESESVSGRLDRLTATG